MSKIGSRIVQFCQQFVAGAFDDRGPRIVVFVDAVAEAHQAEAGIFSLGQIDVFLHVAAIGADVLEHFDAGLICPAVQRAPQGANAGRNRGEQVGVARADHAHRAGAAVLLVIGVHDQEQIQRFDEYRGRPVYVSHGTANIMCKKFWQ